MGTLCYTSLVLLPFAPNFACFATPWPKTQLMALPMAPRANYANNYAHIMGQALDQSATVVSKKRMAFANGDISVFFRIGFWFFLPLLHPCYA